MSLFMPMASTVETLPSNAKLSVELSMAFQLVLLPLPSRDENS
jgi:hypothetical protein